ncbi:hypothetical protein AB0M20_23735 [Actinoplanes sp. NPDC051633]|uniref:hypothetical protein n=1 Tax=Actinoplanes sp. NPDC051633 TaxID=3155670 RepID=UPI00342D0D75
MKWLGWLARRAVELEIAMWRNLFRWVTGRGRRHGEGEEPFAYLGTVKPVLGVFIGLSIVEIPMFDLIVRNVVPWTPARWIFLGLGVWGVTWMLGLWAGMKTYPHVVGPAGIRVRQSSSVDFTIDWADVESVGKRHRSMPSAKSLQIEEAGERRVLHIVVGSQTSVDVRLRRPITVRLPKGSSEPVDEIRLQADDPDAFVRSARAAGTPADGAEVSASGPARRAGGRTGTSRA